MQKGYDHRDVSFILKGECEIIIEDGMIHAFKYRTKN